MAMPRPLDDAADDLLEQARVRLKAEHEVNRHDEQGRRLARRLMVAFVLVLVTAVACFIVVPGMGVHLPPIVPILCFAAIVAGSLMAHAGDAPEPRRPKPCDDEGCPVGCCPGPRPMKMFGKEP